jgi:hypothetical protein
MRTPLDLRIGKHRLQGLEVAVDVTEDGDAHGGGSGVRFRRMLGVGNPVCRIDG